MGYKSKTLTERINEIKNIYLKLEELGLHKRFDSMELFYKDVQIYIKEGICIQNKIKIPEIERVFYYKLVIRNDQVCEALLKFVKGLE
uniref:Uncharacterized protein n=1 Tax=viral metagenome TaxID=1070528 RepID=A0A6C0CQU9_9ZZZZ